MATPYRFLIAFSLLLFFSGSVLAYAGPNLAQGSFVSSCTTCIQYRPLFVSQPDPDFIHVQTERPSCIGSCKSMPVYREYASSRAVHDVRYVMTQQPACRFY